MKYDIKQSKDQIKIHVQDVGKKKEELFDAFSLCQQGKCGCPTDEYQKLVFMSIDERENSITLKLVPKEGQDLDLAELEKCLNYTIKTLWEEDLKII
jgi:hypothetical protein